MQGKLIAVAALVTASGLAAGAAQPSKGSMQAAAELAGFFAAHAVWSVSDGETLIPLVGYETADGKRQMHRLVAERVEDGAARGKAWLAKPPEPAVRAVLVYDGYITLKTDKMDALLVTLRDYTHGEAEITIAVPYRPASHAKGFAVHRPKFFGFKGAAPEWQAIGTALWAGIAQHDKGAAVWNKHLDESK